LQRRDDVQGYYPVLFQPLNLRSLLIASFTIR
jgi:hypothetical protein